MKKILAVIVAGVTLLSCGLVYAEPTITVPVTVVVPEQLDLSQVGIFAVPGETDPNTMNPFVDGTPVSTLDFGTLHWDTDGWGVWRADNFFVVLLAARTSGRPYRITQKCAGIVNGTSNMNKNIIMTPGYVDQDSLSKDNPTANPQGPRPAGSSLGSGGAKVLAVGADKTIYDSGTDGTTRIIRAYYGLATGDPEQLEPTGSQPAGGDVKAGRYNGSITFSVVLK